MIALDNTPAHGDYVRYIDDLMKRAALAAPAVVSSDGDMASNVDALIRERTAVASTGVGSDWTPTAPSVSRRTRPPVPSSSNGFTAPAVASPAAAAASAIASALMSGQVGRPATMSAIALVAVVAVVVGVVLIVVGLLANPLNLASVVGGGVLIGWAVRKIKPGRARST